MGLQINPGQSKYRVGFDDYERMEGLIVGRRGTRKCLKSGLDMEASWLDGAHHMAPYMAIAMDMVVATAP